MTKNIPRNMSFQQGWFVLVFRLPLLRSKSTTIFQLISSTKGAQAKQSKPL